MATPNFTGGTTEWWCPNCRLEYELIPEVSICGVTTGGGPPVPRAQMLDLGHAPTGVPFLMRLRPDGLIEFGVRGEVKPGAPALLSNAQAKLFASALNHMGRVSDARRAHLRGADRWAFRTDGGQTFARLHDQECKIVGYTVGIQRRAYSEGFICDRCRKKLVRGEQAWKAIDWNTTYPVQWQHVRFCARCPTYVVEARVKRGLRVIDGGKGTKPRVG